MNHRFFTGMLAFLLLLGTLFSSAACAKTGDGNETELPTEQGNTSTATDSASESSVSIDLPSNLNYNNTEVNMYCIEKSVDLVGEVDGGTVSVAIFERNTAVENRLKVKLNIIEVGGGDNEYANTFRRLIMADDDTIDIVVGYQFSLMPQVQEGLYRDASELSYLDWEKPWWDETYMKTIQIKNNRHLLYGDISLGMLQMMSTFYVNKELYEDQFGSIDNLYSDVFDGTWTWDEMTTCVSQIYRDNNGNGVADEEDILGIRAFQATPTDHLAYTAGLSLSTRDENGNIVLVEDQTRNIEVIDAVFSLIYENPGCYINQTPESYEKFFVNSFAEGQTLFCSGMTYMADSFTNMTDGYAIIPYPKLDERQEDYKTLVHDSATAFAISTTVQEGAELDMLAAVLEAMCYESYKTVTPAYFDVVLKSRYSSDPKSAQAIDMIRENVFTDFLYANNYNLRQPLGLIARTIIGEKNNRYASLHKSWARQVQKDLDRFNAGIDD